MESRANNNRTHTTNGGMTKGLLLGLLAGGAIGAGIALLYAPKPGRRLRMDIKNKAGDLLDQGEEVITSVRDRASEMAKDARRGITGLFSNTTEREVSRSVKSAGGTTTRSESHRS